MFIGQCSGLSDRVRIPMGVPALRKETSHEEDQKFLSEKEKLYKMGNFFSYASKLVDAEKTSWAKNHSLETNPSLAALQIDMLTGLKQKLHICYKKNAMLNLVEYQHWFITDGAIVIEFGGGDVLENTVLVHKNPKQDYIIDDSFYLTTEIKKRMKQVCGMTNYSLALRNCEHVARYIQSGAWVSFQMSETGPLRDIFFNEMSQKTKIINFIQSFLYNIFDFL